MKKQILSFFTSVVLLFSLFPVGALADDSSSETTTTATVISVDSATAEVGEEVELAVKMTATEFDTFGMVVEYDSNTFELTEFNTGYEVTVEGFGTLTTNYMSVVPEYFAETGKIAVASSSSVTINGYANDGETIFTFTLKVLDDAYNGDYSVGITVDELKLGDYDIENTVVSGTVTVTGGQDFTAEAPEITTQPEGASYTFGDTVAEALTVAARVSDGGTLSYQWYSNTTESNENGTAITGATDASYTPELTEAGTTWYYCVVTNTINGATASTSSDAAAVTVKPLDISESVGVSVADANCVYTGSTNEPEVTVTLDGTVLTAGTDYTVAYANNVNAGESATATVTFTGNYTGETSATFTIQKAAQPMTVTGSASVLIGKTLDLSELVSGAEGDVSYQSDAEGFSLSGSVLTVAETVAADATATITVTASGSDNYESGSATITVTAIDKNDVSEYITFEDDSATYTGDELSIAAATIADDYTGSFSYSYALDGETLSGLPVDAGEYTVTATYEDETNAGSATATFTINPKEITASDFDVDTAAEDYTGAAVTKDITSELAEDTDYTVSYADNTALGTATITITGIGNYTGELTYSFTIVGVDVTGVTLDQTAAELTVGDTLTLTATVLPENATDPTVTWKSGKTSVATVDESGVVTALKAGTAVITATAGDYSATCTVTVTAKEVASTGAALNVESATVAVGGTVPLTVSLAPADTTESVAATTFESSDESVATVDENGVVTGVAAGTATITATVTTDADAEYTLSCTVTVSEELAAADSASVENVESDEIEIDAQVTDVEQAVADYLNETYSTMTYTTTDEDGNETMEEVTGEWEVVSAGSDGTYTVMFTPENTESYATVYATVQAAIARLTPTVEVDYDTISASGKTLEDAALTLVSATCDGEDVDGTLEWDLDETTEVTKGTYYGWTFTPDDTDTYETVTGTILLWKSSGGSSSGGSSSGSSSSGSDSSSGSSSGSTDTGTDYVSGFTDVTTGEYYSDAVAWAVENGVTTGTSDTTFSPNGSCTRAQVVTFLYRLAGEPNVDGENEFADVSSDTYYHDAVIWAVQQGITNGVGNELFDPEATCTRAQIVTFLYRYANSPAAEGGSAFADVESGAYYEDAVVWAEQNDVTNGTSDTTFSPNNACTRAQIVTFLYRAFAE
ncbi:MAG: S-layer homology domain-containing protein [Lachnospiraceae bacterium]|nr:S-layer homology domain-containing protein [Lachnospiraceae bacterium]